LTHPAPHPRVLAVGAYERDNFGDLLFLLVTERYLEGSEVVSASPFSADMTALLDRQVVALGDELQEREYDAIWSVGGQVGGISIETAYRLSTPREEYAAYRRATPDVQERLIAEALNGAPIVSPYIPTPAAFERNAGAVTVLNSVGVAGIAGRPVRIHHELVSVLKTTDIVSVRDKESSDFLTGLGVEHTLAPDVVHAIGVLEPFEPAPDNDVVVLQVSSGIAAQLGHEAIAEQLVGSRHLGGSTVRFVQAGLAAGHDSMADAERIAERIRQLSPSTGIEFATGRRPMEVVEAIRDSRLVIGTSLHVRIIAASYARPRVTFVRKKPTRYARHWDPHMPYNVAVADLEEAMGAALEAGQRPEVVEASRELSRLADQNVRSIAERVRELSAQRAGSVREQRAEARRAALADAAGRADLDVDGIRRELGKTRAELRATQTELARTKEQLAQARSDAQARGRGLGERLLRRSGLAGR